MSLRLSKPSDLRAHDKMDAVLIALAVVFATCAIYALLPPPDWPMVAGFGFLSIWTAYLGGRS